MLKIQFYIFSLLFVEIIFVYVSKTVVNCRQIFMLDLSDIYVTDAAFTLSFLYLLEALLHLILVGYFVYPWTVFRVHLLHSTNSMERPNKALLKNLIVSLNP